MQLTFLGTGSAMPTGERFQAGLLLESSQPLLVDCGSGVLHGLARTDVGYEGVDTVLLTHHHIDHLSDLLVLLKARWLAGKESLTVVGPPGTEALVTDLLEVHEYMQDRVDLTLRDIETDDTGGEDTNDEADVGTVAEFELAGFEIGAFRTRHSMYCLAYRFESPAGPPVVFSGDTEAIPGLVEFADGAAVLVHDCSFPDDVDVSGHPTPSQLGEALARAEGDVGRVYLSHLYPHTDGRHEEMLGSIDELYDGDVRFARDGLSVDVS